MHAVVEPVAQALREADCLEMCYRRDEPSSHAAYFQGRLSLHPRVSRYLEKSFPKGLFVHQGQGLTEIAAGKHLILSTGTSSGKTHVFAAVVLDAFLKQPGCTSLLIYPLKALANDQLELLCSFRNGIGLDCYTCVVEKYDGDVPSCDREAIRAAGHIILTNPDMLHVGILSNHFKWQRFFENLKFVVIDECHSYSGAFGTNFAYVLRRLRQVAKYYGASPQFIACSATMPDAQEHLRQLVGLPFVEVGLAKEHSDRGKRAYFLVRPAEGVDIFAAATRLTTELTELFSVLTFSPTRQQAEKRFRAALRQYPKAASRLAVYRAGLDHGERRRIERDLKEGDIKGVFCTTALELGIDIGALDVCIMVGFPTTMMSMWQRAGRVGRGLHEGAVIILGSDAAIDDYFLKHPDEFFDRKNETLCLYLDNEKVLAGHLACAKREANDNLAELDFGIFGERFKKMASELQQGQIADEILIQPSPHGMVNIRNIMDPSFHIVRPGSDQPIGQISYTQILREAYPGAIYFHGGKSYRVALIKDDEKHVIVKEEHTKNETSPNSILQITPHRVQVIKEWRNALKLCFGQIWVIQRVTGFRETAAGKTVRRESYPQALTRTFRTQATWIEFLGDASQRTAAGLHAAEHALGNVFPILKRCDLFDMRTENVYSAGPHQHSFIYLYDNVYGGLGISRYLFDNCGRVLDVALEKIASCSCTEDSGCPACVRSPRCLSPGKALSKTGAISILQGLIDEVKQTPFISHNGQQLPPELEGEATPLPVEAAAGSLLLIEAGSIVRHDEFGPGQVVERRGDGSYVVDFESRGVTTIASVEYLSFQEGAAKKQCAKCHNEVPQGFKFCPKCGNKL